MLLFGLTGGLPLSGKKVSEIPISRVVKVYDPKDVACRRTQPSNLSLSFHVSTRKEMRCVHFVVTKFPHTGIDV